MKKFLLAILLCISMLLSFGVCAQEQETLSKNVIRLHVIANSDSEADQAVKLLVRDAILETFSDYTSHTDIQTAKNVIQNSLPMAEATANRILKENGFTYTARAEYGVYDFPTRHYGNVTLPAGRYSGLRIHLGEGAGQNWWCVMYPPLCFNEANTSLAETGEDTVTFEVKFKLTEIWNGLKKSL